MLFKEYQMPDEQALKSRLSEGELRIFAEATNLVSAIANKQLLAYGFINEINVAYCKYAKQLKRAGKNPKISVKQQLYKEILKDQPEALKELEQLGHYQA